MENSNNGKKFLNYEVCLVADSATTHLTELTGRVQMTLTDLLKLHQNGVIALQKSLKEECSNKLRQLNSIQIPWEREQDYTL